MMVMEQVFQEVSYSASDMVSGCNQVTWELTGPPGGGFAVCRVGWQNL